MLGIDKRRHAASLLRLGNHLQGNRSFAGRLRAEDFNDPPSRYSADAQRGIERNRARRDHRDGDDGFLRPQPHDGTFAKLLLNLLKCKINCLSTFIVTLGVAVFCSATLVGHDGCSCFLILKSRVSIPVAYTRRLEREVLAVTSVLVSLARSE